MKWHREVDGVYCEHGGMRAWVARCNEGYYWRVFNRSSGCSVATSSGDRPTQRKAKRECEALLKAMEAK